MQRLTAADARAAPRPATPVAPARLVEREAEMQAIDAGLAAARDGSGAVLVLAGAAGIGKSALVEHAAAAAEAGGLRVLHARGHEMEREFAFGLARQLLDPPFAQASSGEREALLADAASPARRVLGAPADLQQDSSFAALHGLYWFVLNLAAAGPLLLCADDLQWADAASLRFLTYLGRRAAGAPVMLLLAFRPADPGVAGELIDELASDAAVLQLHPQPLSESGVLASLREEMGAEVDQGFAQACHGASAGNPLYLRELVRAFEREGITPTSEAVSGVASIWPESIARHVLRRLAAVGPGAPELAAAMSVLGDGGRLAHASRLADVDKAGSLARAMVDAELLARDDPFEFVHPIVQGAIEADLDSDRRAELHLGVARILADESAPAERAAAHLLAVAPGGRSWAVSVLRRAGREALVRGAPDAAASFLRRAVEEPPSPDQRLSVLRELARAEELAADPEAVEHLRLALGEAEDDRERVETALQLGDALETLGQGGKALDPLLDLAGRLEDPLLRRRLEIAAFTAAIADNRATRQDRTVELWLKYMSDTPDGPDGALVLAISAAVAAWAGGPARDAANLAEESIARGVLRSGRWDVLSSPLLALIMTERYEAAEAHLLGLQAQAEREGLARGLISTHQMLGTLAHRTGDLVASESHGRIAFDMAMELGMATTLGWPVPVYLDALVDLGELEQAEELIAVLPPDPWPEHSAFDMAMAARGRLRLAQGRIDEAIEDLLDCRQRNSQENVGIELLGPAPAHWRSSAALALDRQGDRKQALELAHEELDQARLFGTPRALGVSLRAAGIVSGGREGLALLQEAVEITASSPARLVHGEALIALGAALRRAGTPAAARAPLREGLDLARRSAARPLAEFAQQELRASGARRLKRDALSGVDALTPSERRVADLAADGHTNRQIAQTIYLSPKTVEMHLTRVFRKLDLESRAQLGTALGRSDAD
jgi:DNA-binding CsgD family transcriptional regulator